MEGLNLFLPQKLWDLNKSVNPVSLMEVVIVCTL